MSAQICNNGCQGVCDAGWVSCPGTQANKQQNGCPSPNAFSFSLTPTATASFYSPGMTATILSFAAGKATTSLPFNFQFYGTAISTSTTLQVVNTGAVFIGTGTVPTTFTCAAPPTYTNPAIFPYFGSMTATQVTTEILGTAPLRSFVIEWTFGSNFVTVTFEEATNAIQFGYSFTTYSAAGNTQLIGVTDSYLRSLLYSCVTTNTPIAQSATMPQYLRFVPSTSVVSLSQIPSLTQTATSPNAFTATSSVMTVLFPGSYTIANISLPQSWTTLTGQTVTSISVGLHGLISVQPSSYIDSPGNIACSAFPRNDLGLEAYMPFYSPSSTFTVTYQYGQETNGAQIAIVFTNSGKSVTVQIDLGTSRTVYINYGTVSVPTYYAYGVQAGYSKIVSCSGNPSGSGWQKYSSTASTCGP